MSADARGEGERSQDADEGARVPDHRLAPREPVLPEQTADDTDEGWGERLEDDDRRLLEDRPPHWSE